MFTMVNQRIQDSPELMKWTREARKDFKGYNSKDLINRLPAMLNKGLAQHKNKQTKEAYVLLTRYLHIVEQLQKRHLDNEQKKELNAAMKIDEAKAVQEAIIASMNANKISQQSQSPGASTATAAIIDTKNFKLKNTTLNEFDGDGALNLPEIPTDEPIMTENTSLDNFINCRELFLVIQEGKRYLLIDIRPDEDYQNSRIKADKCINIPQCDITTGLTAKKFEGYLQAKNPIHAKLYSERSQAYVDIIVLIDWDTNRSTLTTHSPVSVMKAILTDWDPGTARSRHVILDGGYSEWLNVYPTMTTNPQVSSRTPVNNAFDEILAEYSYPDWIDQESPDTVLINYPSKNNNNDISKIRNSDIPGLHMKVAEPLNNKRSAKSFTPPVKQLTSFDEEDVDVVGNLSQKINKLDFERGPSNNGTKPIIDRSNKPTPNPQFDRLLELITHISEDLRAQTKLEKQSYQIENDILMRLTTNSNNINYDDDDDDLESMYTKRQTVQNTISTILNDKEEKEAAKLKINTESIQFSEHEKRQLFRAEVAMSELKHRVQGIARERKETQLKICEAEKRREDARLKGSPKHDGNAVYKEPLKSENSTTNSGLKRSMSSPNLAKVDDRKVPIIDRSSKPHAIRRNLKEPNNNNSTITSWKDSLKRMDPVYRNGHPGITGLKNLGNSCYMNSIIQCLSNTSYLAKYFIDNGYQDDLNTNSDNETRGQIAEEFAQVIKALWRGQYKSIAPRDLKDTIGQYRLQFDSCEQQDSHEFLTFLLEWMHNDLKKDGKMRIDGILSPADREWEKALKGQFSIISRLFMGQLRSTICCTTCSGKSITYETFTSLSISLPDANRCTLDECIKHFLSGQRISGWNCPHCKAAREATKKFDFVKLPPIIVIHLNRFSGTDVGLEKKNTMVIFPINDLNLKQYLVVDADSNTLNHAHSYSYNLYGLSNHYGSMGGGHYTAFCKSAALSKWYKYDDHSVSEINEQNVRSQNSYAYLLFYTSFPYESYTFIDDSS